MNFSYLRREPGFYRRVLKFAEYSASRGNFWQPNTAWDSRWQPNETLCVMSSIQPISNAYRFSG